MAAARLALLAAAAAPALVSAQVPLWQQCGGEGYTGSTQCVEGAFCTSWNPYYYQCYPGTSTGSPATTTSTPVTVPATTTTTTSIQTTTTSSSVPSPTGDVKYFINFGDSYSQTGFDINGNKPNAANPIGNPNLPGWTASGGYNWVGFVTSQLNTSTLLTYNFAYGGATTNATLVAPWQPTVLSLVDQVAQFSGSIASHPSYAPWTADNTLVGIWMGVNDVGNSWWKSDYADIVEQIMDTYFGQLQIIYNAGARNFVLLTVPPIHKTPAMLQESQETRDTEAAAIDVYNAAIAARLDAFKAANSGVEAQIVDTAVAFNKALDNPTQYGSPDASCYNEDGTSCLWFNDYHPGVEINRLVAEDVVDAWYCDFF